MRVETFDQFRERSRKALNEKGIEQYIEIDIVAVKKNVSIKKSF